MQTECQLPVATQLMGIPQSASTALGSSSGVRAPCPNWPWLLNYHTHTFYIKGQLLLPFPKNPEGWVWGVPAQSPGVHSSWGTEEHSVLCTQSKTLGFQMRGQGAIEGGFSADVAPGDQRQIQSRSWKQWESTLQPVVECSRRTSEDGHEDMPYQSPRLLFPCSMMGCPLLSADPSTQACPRTPKSNTIPRWRRHDSRGPSQ